MSFVGPRPLAIPATVTAIGQSAFSYNMSLTSVTLPEGVTELGDSAFTDCYNLTDVVLPQSLTSIGESAFGECTSLTGIAIPAAVSTIGDMAFAGCRSMTSFTVAADNMYYSSENGVLYDKAKTELICCPALTTDISIPAGVTRIADRAFWYCVNLTDVVIPDGVTEIGNYVFDYCDNLLSVTVPASVTQIGYSLLPWTSEGCVLYCVPGSYAETYAISEGINVAYISQ